MARQATATTAAGPDAVPTTVWLRRAQPSLGSDAVGSVAFEHGDRAQAPFEVVLDGPGGEQADLVGRRRLRRGERLVEAAAEDRRASAPAQPAMIGAPDRHVRHSTPPSSRSKATSVTSGSTRRSARRRRAAGAGPRRRAASRRTPAPPAATGRSAIVRSTPTSIRYSCGLGSRSSAIWSTASSTAIPCDARSRSASSGASDSTDSAWLTMSSSRPAVQQQPHVAHRLEPGAELGRRLAHALGDGAHLAVVAR